MNVFTFSGNLGKDGEQRYTANQKPVLEFSVAVNSGYGERKKTNWVRCALFGERGDSLAPYLVKGKQVVVTGELELNEWEGNDGVKHATLQVRVAELTLIGGNSGANPSGQRQSPSGGSGGTDAGRPQQSGGQQQAPQQQQQNSPNTEQGDPGASYDDDIPY
jgi:single-strand DNA-binding protein